MRLLSLVLLLSVDAMCQFDVNTYLARSSNEVEIQALNAQMDFLSETDFRSPFFREFEFRMRTRDFETGFDDFRFRISPLNPYERRANKQYASAIDAQMQSEILVNYTTVLESRYQILIKHIYLRNISNSIEQGEQYYRQLMLAKSKVREGGGGSAKDLIQLDKKLFSISLKKDNLEAELERVEYLIGTGYTFDGDISWNDYPLVSVESIQNTLEFIDQTDPSTNLYVQNERNKIRVAENDLEINKQESFSNIGYIQAEYRPYQGETLSETMGMQIGFQLPIVDPDRPDLERRKLRLIEDQEDVLEMQRDVEMNLFSYKNKLEAAIRQYDKVSLKIESLLKFAPSASTSTVEVLLELREYKEDLQEMQQEIYSQILSSYITLLQYHGLLARAPYRNYLSDEFTEFDMEMPVR